MRLRRTLDLPKIVRRTSQAPITCVTFEAAQWPGPTEPTAGVVLDLRESPLGDRSLATGLKSPSYPQCLGLSDPRTGVREYSCGPTTDKHAGGFNEKNRSDMHKYLNIVGGFLRVDVKREKSKPVAIFRHHGVNGKVLNEDIRVAR